MLDKHSTEFIRKFWDVYQKLPLTPILASNSVHIVEMKSASSSMFIKIIGHGLHGLHGSYGSSSSKLTYVTFNMFANELFSYIVII